MPILATEITEELAADVHELVCLIREAEDPTDYRKEGVEIILELSRSGLDAFFLEPAKRLGLGMISLSAVKLGLRTAAGGIAVFIKKLGRGLDAEQMLQLADIIEEMVSDDEPATELG